MQEQQWQCTNRECPTAMQTMCNAICN